MFHRAFVQAAKEAVSRLPALVLELVTTADRALRLRSGINYAIPSEGPVLHSLLNGANDPFQ